MNDVKAFNDLHSSDIVYLFNPKTNSSLSLRIKWRNRHKDGSLWFGFWEEEIIDKGTFPDNEINGIPFCSCCNSERYKDYLIFPSYIQFYHYWEDCRNRSIKCFCDLREGDYVYEITNPRREIQRYKIIEILESTSKIFIYVKTSGEKLLNITYGGLSKLESKQSYVSFPAYGEVLIADDDIMLDVFSDIYKNEMEKNSKEEYFKEYEMIMNMKL